MDIDVLRVSGKSEWKRLEELTHARTLSGPEIDELGPPLSVGYDRSGEGA